MSAIAQGWRDFQEHCYRRPPLARELEREYRMLFYAGWHACQIYFRDMMQEDLSPDEMHESVAECFAEFERFAKEYLTERQQE